MQDFINSYTKGVKKIPEVGRFYCDGTHCSPAATWGLLPQTKLQAPSNWNINNTNQWSFCQILICQAPLHKRPVF